MSALENKIPPPLVAIIFASFMWAVAHLSPALELAVGLRYGLAATLWLLGAGLALSAAISFRRAQTTVNPLKPESASSLVTGGVFSISRNPMYVSFSLFLLAWGVFLAAPYSLILVAGYIAYIQRFQIRPEEAAMAKLFGEQFDLYRQQVRRWL